MTDLIYPKVETIDDACDWTNVIIWRMNAGARARSRSIYVPCPRPVPITAQLFSRYCRLFMLTGSSSSSANIFPLYRLRWRMLIPLFTTFRRLLTQALK